MTLDEYLYENDLTIQEFAKCIGYHPNYLCMVKNGKKPITKRIHYLVLKNTNNAVDLYKKNNQDK